MMDDPSNQERRDKAHDQCGFTWHPLAVIKATANRVAHDKYCRQQYANRDGISVAEFHFFLPVP